MTFKESFLIKILLEISLLWEHYIQKKQRKKVSSLWWLIAFSIIITTSIYIALNDKAEIDIIVEKQRLTALLFGVFNFWNLWHLYIHE